MIAYFDTSALMKCVVEEPGSEVAMQVWDAAETIVSSVLVYPEVRAAASAAHRGVRLIASELRRAVRAIDRMYEDMSLVGVDGDLTRYAGVLAERHGLRGYDAVHLASVLDVSAPRVVVTTWDRDLSAASTANGVAVVPYEA
jgi:uncharacterized protein